jgi:hypothetical protein
MAGLCVRKKIDACRRLAAHCRGACGACVHATPGQRCLRGGRFRRGDLHDQAQSCQPVPRPPPRLSGERAPRLRRAPHPAPGRAQRAAHKPSLTARRRRRSTEEQRRNAERVAAEIEEENARRLGGRPPAARRGKGWGAGEYEEDDERGAPAAPAAPPDAGSAQDFPSLGGGGSSGGVGAPSGRAMPQDSAVLTYRVAPGGASDVGTASGAAAAGAPPPPLGSFPIQNLLPALAMQSTAAPAPSGRWPGDAGGGGEAGAAAPDAAPAAAPEAEAAAGAPGAPAVAAGAGPQGLHDPAALGAFITQARPAPPAGSRPALPPYRVLLDKRFDGCSKKLGK